MNPPDVIKSITNGFGSTLASIGIVIGFGVMMGRILEISGAAQRMAYTFLKIFGKGREELAMALTGYVVSIPIFCDSGFVILSPIAKALSRTTKISNIHWCSAGSRLGSHSPCSTTNPRPIRSSRHLSSRCWFDDSVGLSVRYPITIVGVLYAKC